MTSSSGLLSANGGRFASNSGRFDTAPADEIISIPVDELAELRAPELGSFPEDTEDEQTKLRFRSPVTVSSSSEFARSS